MQPHRQIDRQTDRPTYTDRRTDSHAVAYDEQDANCNADHCSQYNDGCQQPRVYFQWTSLSPTEWWHPALIHISVQLLNQWIRIPSGSIQIGCVHTSIFRTRERRIRDGHSATTLLVQASNQQLWEFSDLRTTGNMCMACHGKVELNLVTSHVGSTWYQSCWEYHTARSNNVGILYKNKASQ